MWKRKSPYSVKKTLDRLETIVRQTDEIHRFARINHADILRSVGAISRPMEMLLMENQALIIVMFKIDLEAAFELPIRALAWEDKFGQTWVRVTDPQVLGRSTNLSDADGIIETIYHILDDMLDKTLDKEQTAITLTTSCHRQN